MAERDTDFDSDTLDRMVTYGKYLVYALLSVNIFLFLQEELLALEYTFVDGFELGEVIQVFSASIDTTAWVVLLLLFELETAVLDDSKIHGPMKWSLHGIRMICYVAVFYAFTGYYAELVTLYQTTLMAGFDACSSLEQGWSILTDIDEYEPLSAVNCGSLGGNLHQLADFDILVDDERLQSARWLGWTDVINSAAWLLVVIVLEIEVRLQLRGSLSDRIMNATKIIKYAVYGSLFVCAAYWGVAGDFLDFWDAALWLFAFIFIELNVFEWQAETSQHETANV